MVDPIPIFHQLKCQDRCDDPMWTRWHSILSVFLMLVAAAGFSAPDSAVRSQSAQPVDHVAFQTLAGEFLRVSQSEAVPETTRGHFWFFDQDRMLLDVTHPLQQIMSIEGTELLIYYPEPNRGFRLASTHAVILPIIPGLVAATRADAGFGLLGMEVVEYSASGDTIDSWWKLPEDQHNQIRNRLRHVGDRLIQSYTHVPSAHEETTIDFSSFLEVHGVAIPLQVEFRRQDKTTVYHESVWLSDIIVDGDIPADIRFYRPPPDADIEYREW